MKRRELMHGLMTLIASSGARALPLTSIIHETALDLSISVSDGALPAASMNADMADPVFAGPATDFHGFVMHTFKVGFCSARIVFPKAPQSGRRWVWRTMFWDAFPGADVAFLNSGFYVAFLDVGNTFGCPDAMKYFDAFYHVMTTQYGFSRKVTLEGLSRGGLYAYRWAHLNADKIGCIYGDSPVCDMKSWPGGKGKGSGSPGDWLEAILLYRFEDETEMMNFKGNPVDTLAPLAAARIPILHVCGDADTTVPKDENTEVLRQRYMALEGEFALIVKEGCNHHPHGLADPTPVVNFVLAHCGEDAIARRASAKAPQPGTVTMLAQGQW